MGAGRAVAGRRDNCRGHPVIIGIMGLLGTLLSYYHPPLHTHITSVRLQVEAVCSIPPQAKAEGWAGSRLYRIMIHYHGVQCLVCEIDIKSFEYWISFAYFLWRRECPIDRTLTLCVTALLLWSPVQHYSGNLSPLTISHYSLFSIHHSTLHTPSQGHYHTATAPGAVHNLHKKI